MAKKARVTIVYPVIVEIDLDEEIEDLGETPDTENAGELLTEAEESRAFGQAKLLFDSNIIPIIHAVELV